MDAKTLEIYDSNALHYADTWLSQVIPAEIHEIIKYYFRPGAPTADIGSGSGRDSHWLNENGYPCTGFDASLSLRTLAQRRFPKIEFKYACLPLLKEISDETFQNILCETVLMHLPSSQHIDSLTNLIRITKKGGVISLSWRHPLATINSREEDGRLYEIVDREELIQSAKKLGAEILYQNTSISSSSGKRIDQLVLKKN